MRMRFWTWLLLVVLVSGCADYEAAAAARRERDAAMQQRRDERGMDEAAAEYARRQREERDRERREELLDTPLSVDTPWNALEDAWAACELFAMDGRRALRYAEEAAAGDPRFEVFRDNIASLVANGDEAALELRNIIVDCQYFAGLLTG